MHRNTPVVDEQNGGFTKIQYHHLFGKGQSQKYNTNINLKKSIITVRFNQKPRGGWLPKSLSGKCNRNLHEIENKDLMCGQRCLVLARMYATGQEKGKSEQHVSHVRIQWPQPMAEQRTGVSCTSSPLAGHCWKWIRQSPACISSFEQCAGHHKANLLQA